MNVAHVVTLLVTLSMLVSCNILETEQTSSSEFGNLQLTLTNIDPTAGQHYEGWIIAGGEAITTGRFNINSNGDIISVNSAGVQTGVISQTSTGVFSFVENGSTPSAFVLTIEPNGDTNPGPSSVHLLGGGISGSSAITGTVDSSAIGADFDSSLGTYILATPTSASTTDDNQGVWFLNSGSASLVLPALGTGWAYEGWVVNRSTGIPVSTGTFLSATGADSNGGGPAAGTNAAPNFPGEDYITPPTVLTDGNYDIVISVEPVPDFDPAPFTIKILLSGILNGQSTGTASNHSLTNINNANNISIRVDLL